MHLLKHSKRIPCAVAAFACFAFAAQVQGVEVAESTPMPASSGAQAAGVTPSTPIELRVDATDVDHRRLQVQEVVPVHAGRVTLEYPRWIPGTHSPIGTVYRLAGLEIHALKPGEHL